MHQVSAELILQEAAIRLRPSLQSLEHQKKQAVDLAKLRLVGLQPREQVELGEEHKQGLGVAVLEVRVDQKLVHGQEVLHIRAAGHKDPSQKLQQIGALQGQPEHGQSLGGLISLQEYLWNKS